MILLNRGWGKTGPAHSFPPLLFSNLSIYLSVLRFNLLLHCIWTLMIVLYPLPELVYIFCLQQFSWIFESTVHNNRWMFTTFMLNLGLSFFFILQIQISQLPTWSGPTLLSSLLVNTCSLITDTNLGEIQCIVYKIIQSIMHHTFMHAHTPTQNLWLWPKRPPLAFSVSETIVAEMSGPKRPRPKCPCGNVLHSLRS